MLPLRRQAGQQLRAAAGRQSRRHASTHDHGHADHSHAGKDEPLGTAFYVAVGVVPVAMAVSYMSQASADGSKPALTKYIESWSSVNAEDWAAKNDLRTKMMAKAAEDRNLFYNSVGSRTVDLKFPEIVNSGSPYNVPAGYGSSSIDQLIAHYEKERAEELERKAKKSA